jgi:lipid-A-disaccharide synthase
LNNPTIYLSAGEASGDAHGAGVVAELRARYPEADLFGLGGDKMRTAGMELLEHAGRMSFMGFAEVIRHLPFIMAVRKRVLDEIVRRQPDLLVLIDYPGFHFSILRKLAAMKLAKKPKVLYYISPQVWAWKAGRAKELADFADHIAVIFPFEVEIYQKLGVPVTFVGHPLLDEVVELPPRGQFLKTYGMQGDDRVVGLFPGSRKQEIRRHLPVLLETVKLLRRFHPEFKFLLAESPTLKSSFYDKFLEGTVGIARVAGQSHAILAHANASLVKSGSSTLEAAYYGNPFVVYYKTSAASYAIGKRVVGDKLKFIAMANLIAGEEAVKELIQDDATPENLMSAILPLLTVPAEIEACRARLKKVRAKLGEPGAATRVAEIAINLIEK